MRARRVVHAACFAVTSAVSSLSAVSTRRAVSTRTGRSAASSAARFARRKAKAEEYKALANAQFGKEAWRVALVGYLAGVSKGL